MVTNHRYNRLIAITKSDTVDLAGPDGRVLTDAIYVGGAGNIVAVLEDGSTVTLNGALAGTILPVAIRRVNSTNTTATNLVACYWM